METKLFKSIATAPKNLNVCQKCFLVIQITDSEQYLSNCAGAWHFLLGIAACHTSFHSFIPGKSPVGRAV